MTKRRSVWVVEYKPRGTGKLSWEAHSEGMFHLFADADELRKAMRKRYVRHEWRTWRYDARK